MKVSSAGMRWRIEVLEHGIHLAMISWKLSDWSCETGKVEVPPYYKVN